jgi:LacI family transcriptional regulator
MSMTQFQRVTINQVADAAGVSIKTVSRVINNLPDVAPETRKKVKDIIAQLGYQPNAIARGLASKKTRTIGLINANFTDGNIALMVKGVKCQALKRGYLIILGSTDIDQTKQLEYVRILSNRYVEGIIFVRPCPEAVEDRLTDVTNLQEILNAGIPVVVLTSLPVKHPHMIVVDTDNVYGGRIATQYLLQLGHNRIATITGPTSASSVVSQTLGYSQALKEAKIPLRNELIATGDWSYQSGAIAVQQLLERNVEFTAIVAQNDRMAMGAIHILAKHKLRVPEDVSIIGYDNEEWTEFCRPPLTTISLPFEQMGEIAAQMLIDRIEGQEHNNVHQDIILQPSLIERASCIAITH